MAQLLVRADNGQVAHVAPDDHVWGLRECWPSFVLLRVPQSVAAVRALLDAAASEIGRSYVDLDALTTGQVSELATTGSTDANLAALTVAATTSQATALAAATVMRAAEKAAFIAWGLDPTPEKRAAYEAIRDAPGGNSQPVQVKPRGR